MVFLFLVLLLLVLLNLFVRFAVLPLLLFISSFRTIAFALVVVGCSLSLIGCRVVDRLPCGRRTLLVHPLSFMIVVVVSFLLLLFVVVVVGRRDG